MPKISHKECLKSISENFEKYFKSIGSSAKQCDLTEMANVTSLSTATIQAGLTGQRMTSENLIILANYFHISTDYLLGLEDNMLGFNQYSDIFFYLKYMIDKKILIFEKMEMVDDDAWDTGVMYGLPEADRPESTPDYTVKIPMFVLNGKFDNLMMQYIKIAKIMQCKQDSKYLKCWRDITVESLDENREIKKRILSSKKNAYRSGFKEVQDHRHLTNDQLRERLYISLNSVSKYRNPYNFPPVEVVKQMAQALSVSADHILGLTNNYDRNISEENLLDLLIWLYHQGFLMYYHHKYQEIEKVHINNQIFYQFCKIYHSRFKICTDLERRDFLTEAQKNFTYHIISKKDMTVFEQIKPQNLPQPGFYMEDYAAWLKKYASLHPNIKTNK